MNVLTLIIKEQYLLAIIAGTKKTEVREVRPNTSAKYCAFATNGDYVGPRPYDAIQFYAGYNKDRKSALVKVTKAELIVLTDEKTGADIIYRYEGNDYIACEMEYTLGEVINKNF